MQIVSRAKKDRGKCPFLRIPRYRAATDQNGMANRPMIIGGTANGRRWLLYATCLNLGSQRFRQTNSSISSSDSGHELSDNISLLFELFMHHFLLRCGFQVEFHPDIHGVNTHPDFLVSRNGQALFYLEANQ